jgi:hypothetical protein
MRGKAAGRGNGTLYRLGMPLESTFEQVSEEIAIPKFRARRPGLAA